jgi:peptide/nickel transport system substrate-binding protein
MGNQHDSNGFDAITRRKLLASGVAVSGAALAGCLSPSGEGDSDGAEGESGDQLNVTQQVAPIEWDPVVANDAYSAQIYHTIYDGLYEFQPGELDMEPKLAADMPEIEEDGQRFIVELREEPEFSDGTPVTAQDVIHTFTEPV